MKEEIGFIGHAGIGKTTLTDRIQHQLPVKEDVVIDEGTLEDFSKKQLKDIEVEVIKLQSNIHDTPMSGKERRRERRKFERKSK